VGLPDVYVGKVVDDTGSMGQRKVFIPGVYPDSFENVVDMDVKARV
jgi:hypothetical protein